MSVINSDSMRAGASGAGAAGYVIDQSLRLDTTGNTRTRRTYGTPDNSKLFSVSVWFKIGVPGTERNIMGGLSGSGGTAHMKINNQDRFVFVLNTNSGSAVTLSLSPTMKLRDPSAWYHALCTYDSAQATAANRGSVAINGITQTVFTSESYPSLNLDSTDFNGPSKVHSIGISNEDNGEFGGYLAEMAWGDGVLWTLSDVGEFNDQGIWVPIDISELTYGGEGWHLDFAVAPGTGNGAGTDVSGNGNHFTDSGLAANDQVTDSPTDDADNDIGNYCTMNPLNLGPHITLANGNLEMTASDTAHSSNWCAGTIFPPTTGKWYWEIASATMVEDQGLGIFEIETSDLVHGSGMNPTSDSAMYAGELAGGGDMRNRNGTSYESHTPPTTIDISNDVIIMAYDADNNRFWSGYWDVSTSTAQWMDAGTGFTGDPVANSGGETITGPVAIIGYARSSTGVCLANFGQLGFVGTPPSGFKKLNTANLPAPTIKDPSKFYQTDLFTGTGSELVRTLTDGGGGAVKPDLVWIKDRDTSVEHVLTDSARGATKEINPDSSLTETTVAEGLKSFDTSGFTLGTDSNYNASSSLNVAWCWNTQGGAGSSNTAGSINTTTTSVGATQGMSISTFVGTGVAATIGHGLSSAPEFIMVKNRTVVGHDWAVYHKDQNATPEDFYLVLDEAAAPVDAADRWNDTAPTSTLFSLGTADHVNESGGSIVAFCWHGVEGYSKFGSYEGNASSDGPFVWCGFRPAWILIKDIDVSRNWILTDSARAPFNQTNAIMLPDEAGQEETSNDMDILSNGFKLRDAHGGTNYASTYIFAAFAEFPFGGEDVSQARAR
jgi:hypothetical protein